MSDDTDFAALYRELGIDTTGSLQALRNAYRRRVAKLHPDQGGDAEDTGRLQQLNRLYDAACDFHRRYGRLPGAPAPSMSARPGGATGKGPWATDTTTTDSTTTGTTTAGAPTPDATPTEAMAADTAATGPTSTGTPSSPRSQAHTRLARTGPAEAYRPPARDARDPAEETPPAGFGTMSRYFVAIALLGMAVLAWRAAQHGDSVPLPAEASSRTGMETGSPEPVADRIVPGMDKSEVRDILGEPIQMHELRWSYDPSWVEFRCDKVVDWYSSPLRPLRVSETYGPMSRPATPGAPAEANVPVPDNVPCD